MNTLSCLILTILPIRNYIFRFVERGILLFLSMDNCRKLMPGCTAQRCDINMHDLYLFSLVTKTENQIDEDSITSRLLFISETSSAIRSTARLYLACNSELCLTPVCGTLWCRDCSHMLCDDRFYPSTPVGCIPAIPSSSRSCSRERGPVER